MVKVQNLPSVKQLISYKPITNTAWVQARLCKLQKRVHTIPLASFRSHGLPTAHFGKNCLVSYLLKYVTIVNQNGESSKSTKRKTTDHKQEKIKEYEKNRTRQFLPKWAVEFLRTTRPDQNPLAQFFLGGGGGGGGGVLY
jgi:hypothetical protein